MDHSVASSAYYKPDGSCGSWLSGCRSAILKKQTHHRVEVFICSIVASFGLVFIALFAYSLQSHGFEKEQIYQLMLLNVVGLYLMPF